MKPKVPFVRRFVTTWVLMVVIAPIMLYGAWQTMEGIFTSALRWLSPTDEGRQLYDDFARRFEGGNVILASWEGCNLSDERLLKLQTALDPTDSDAPLLHRQIFLRVFSGQTVLRRLRAKPINLRRREAVARLQGTLIGPDGDMTCLVAVLSEDGVRRRVEALESVIEAAKSECGLSHAELKLAGPPVDAIAIDYESDRSVDVYSIPSAIICFVLCMVCLRSLPLTLAILATGGFGELLALGSLHFAGVTMDAVLITLPPLVFVLTVSAGVHLANYYFDELRHDNPEDAPRRAMKNGVVPCTLAAVTTAIGLGSLLVSHIVPVKTFGLFASLGVLTTLLLLFAILPGVMQKWAVSDRRLRRIRWKGDEARKNGWDFLANPILRSPVLVAVAGLAVLAAGFAGVARITTSVGVRSLFSANSRVMQDYEWMQTNVAKLVPLEVIVHFPADDKTRFVRRIEIVQDIEQQIRAKVDRVGGTMSVASMSPRIPKRGGLNNIAARSRLNSRLYAHRDRFVEANYFYESAAGQDWRISSRVSGVEDGDYERILQELRAVVDPAVEEHAVGVKGLNATYTGVMQ